MKAMRSQNSSVTKGLLYFLLPLILAAIACEIPGISNETSLQQTNVALGIQQTMNAINDATLQAQLTQVVNVNPTVAPQQNIQATLDAQATALVLQLTQSALPATAEATATVESVQSPTATPTTATVSLEAISITDWGMRFWVPLNSGCKVDGAGCWKMNDDYDKHLGTGELILVSKTPVRINPDWPNPYLVLWHRYKFNNTAHIDLQIDGKWSTVKILNRQSSSNNWVREIIKLADYKGKEIIVRFAAAGIWGSGGIPGSSWYVNDVRIVPDYNPNQ
jgi:hypothetical protein